jgi:hypothetical protein
VDSGQTDFTDSERVIVTNYPAFTTISSVSVSPGKYFVTGRTNLSFPIAGKQAEGVCRLRLGDGLLDQANVDAGQPFDSTTPRLSLSLTGVLAQDNPTEIVLECTRGRDDTTSMSEIGSSISWIRTEAR